MVEIELCEGLIKQLNPGEFDAMGLNPAQFNINSITCNNYIIEQTAPIETLQQGEWVPFANAPTYVGWYDGEQTIEVSECSCGQDPDIWEKFYGWNQSQGATKTEVGWKYVLWGETNPKAPLSQIPGYTGTGQFLNLATLGMKIFDLRTAPPKFGESQLANSPEWIDAR